MVDTEVPTDIKLIPPEVEEHVSSDLKDSTDTKLLMEIQNKEDFPVATDSDLANGQILELITDACQTICDQMETNNSLENSLISECKLLNQSLDMIRHSSSQCDFGTVRSKIEKSYKQVSTSRKMKKYYNRRYILFTRFDEGILLDNESWFSVTPEKTARYLANEIYKKMASMSDLTILDAFCGSGGNTIQFCKYFENVIACDIDLVKLQCAQHNATIYNVNNNLSFVMQDFFALHKTLKTKLDVIFLSPPWGGVNYFHSKFADISEFPLDCFKIYLYCVNELKCKNIVFFLPRNTNLEQILLMAGPGGKVRVEQNFIDHKLVALTAYYGDLCDNLDHLE